MPADISTCTGKDIRGALCPSLPVCSKNVTRLPVVPVTGPGVVLTTREPCRPSYGHYRALSLVKP